MIVLLTLLISFNTNAQIIAPKETHPYIESFQKRYGKPFKLTVRYGDVGTPTIKGATVLGYCTFTKNGPLIVLSPSWKTSSNRAWTLWHEMGHCVLKRHHDNSTFSNGKPTSIMNELDFPISKKDTIYYFEELFH